MSTARIEILDPNQIVVQQNEDGRPLNPRHAVRDTTGLQKSISELQRKGAGVDGTGVVQPIIVLEDGDRYYLRSGHRRLTAVKILGLDRIPAVVETVQGQVSERMLMLLSDNQVAPPTLVLNGNGEIVGGKALAVVEELNEATEDDERTLTMEDLALVLDERPDVISAYFQMMFAPPNVQKAIATGRLSVTAFARMKHMPPQFQEEVVESVPEDDTVSVRKVRKTIQQKRKDAIFDPKADPSEEDDLQFLNLVKERIRYIGEHKTRRTQVKLHEIKVLLEDLL